MMLLPCRTLTRNTNSSHDLIERRDAGAALAGRDLSVARKSIADPAMAHGRHRSQGHHPWKSTIRTPETEWAGLTIRRLPQQTPRSARQADFWGRRMLAEATQSTGLFSGCH